VSGSKRFSILGLIGLCLMAGAIACASKGGDAIPSPPDDALPHGYSSAGVENWPMPPPRIEELFAADDYEIIAAKSAGAGVTGAMKATIRFPSFDETLNVKWKRMPSPRLDGMNNSPRKEMAVYEIQKWFLDPEDYVVPTLSARCVPLEIARRYRPEAAPTLPGTSCVLGVAAVWLENVTVPDQLLDEARFANDSNYAYHMANFNLLTYLVRHRDGRDGNFLVSRDEQNRRIFAVDNGIAFGGLVYNYFVPNWDRLRVPALRRETIERLRRVERSDIEKLGVLVHFEKDGDGMLRRAPAPGNLDPSRGVRVQGSSVQLGLTRSEIDRIEERLDQLLEDVDTGKVAVY